jgi:hypothetical protein
MAISVPSKSAQYTDYTASPKVMVKPTDWGSTIRASYAKLTFTAAGFTTAAAGDIGLIRMPAGRVRILPDLSRVVCPIGTATSDLDVGYGAHVGLDGVAVALDGDAFVASADVGAAAIDAAFDAATVLGLEFTSQAGFDIVCSFDTANSPAAGDLIVVVAYQLGQ